MQLALEILALIKRLKAEDTPRCEECRKVAAELKDILINNSKLTALDIERVL